MKYISTLNHSATGAAESDFAFKGLLAVPNVLPSRRLKAQLSFDVFLFSSPEPKANKVSLKYTNEPALGHYPSIRRPQFQISYLSNRLADKN